MNNMSKKLALTAIFATALALAIPATDALARGGGGGGGGHMGGGGGGHMGGGFGGGHMGGGFGGGHVVGGMGGQAFGSAGAFHGRGVHAGLHDRRFIGRGFNSYDSCWDWQSTPLGWVCQYPYE
jgi:hypothetical protein